MNFVKKILLYIKYGKKSNSKLYVNYLKRKGIKIGEDVTIYSPWTVTIDIQRPWMIEIGSNVKITSGVKILQHGFDWAILKKKYGICLGSSGKVTIGDNVFIGVNTTILKGVSIGNNIIIGANSLVNKPLEKEGIYAGNPAKYIMSLDDYLEKRKSKQLEEAIELVTEYYNKYGKYPKKEVLREFFWIFEERNKEINPTFNNVLKIQSNYIESINEFLNSTPLFNGYESFIEYVRKSEDD